MDAETAVRQLITIGQCTACVDPAGTSPWPADALTSAHVMTL